MLFVICCEGCMKLLFEQLLILQCCGGIGVYWMYLFFGFVLLFVIVIVLFIWNVYFMFIKWWGVCSFEFIGFENWQKIFIDSDFWMLFMNLVWMIIVMVVVFMIVGFIVVVFFFDVVGCKFGGKVGSFLCVIYYFLQIFLIVVVGIVIGWIVCFGGDGVFNQIFGWFGLFVYDWFGQMFFVFIVLMVVMVWVQFGYLVVVFMVVLQCVDFEFYEVVEFDGVNWFQCFMVIIMSIIWLEIFVVILICMIVVFKVFGLVYIIMCGGFVGVILVFVYYVYQEFFMKWNIGYGVMIVIVFIIVVVIVLIVFICVQNLFECKERVGL